MAKTFRFGTTELKTFSEKDHFNTFLRENLTEKEQCIIDNLWNLPTLSHEKAKKAAIIHAVVNSFFWEKTFTCYVLYTGPKAGVYYRQEEIVPLLEEIKTLRNPRYGLPIYKGFDEIDEAIKSAVKYSGEDIIISPDVVKHQELQNSLN